MRCFMGKAFRVVFHCGVVLFLMYHKVLNGMIYLVILYVIISNIYAIVEKEGGE